MRRMTVPAFLAAGALAVTLAGCSGGSQAMDQDTLMGLWDLDPQSEVGFDAYVQFEEDDYAEVLIADSWLEGTWSVSGTQASLTIDEDRVVQLSYNNGKLTMGSQDGSKLVFMKDGVEGATLDDKLVDDSSDLDVEANGATVEGVEVDDAEESEGSEVIEPIEPVGVVDDDKVAINVTGKGTDSTGDPGYQISVTNKTDKAVFVVPDDTFKVGGAEVESGFGETIEPGATTEVFMYFDHEELGGGVEKLAAVDGAIYVGDDETGDEVAVYPFHMD